MMGLAATLPRIKARKRRRRPMTPIERLATLGLIANVLAVLVMLADIVIIPLGVGWDALFVLGVIASYFCARYIQWPIVRNYIYNGWIDE